MASFRAKYVKTQKPLPVANRPFQSWNRLENGKPVWPVGTTGSTGEKMANSFEKQFLENMTQNMR